MDKTLKAYLVNECQTIAERMQDSSDRDGLYYFSALYSAAQRILNIEPSVEMLRLHVISNWVYQSMNSRQQSDLQQAGSFTPVLAPGLVKALGEVVGEIGQKVADDANYSNELDEMCRIGYASTGNGYYLLQTGRL